MKALSVSAPKAALVATGHSRIVTLSWKTAYRGPLAIASAKNQTPEALRLAYVGAWHDALEPLYGRLPVQVGRGRTSGWADDLPAGVVVAIATLVSVVRAETLTSDDGALRCSWALTAIERVDARLDGGHWAWLLDDVVALDPPATATGSHGLWEWAAPA